MFEHMKDFERDRTRGNPVAPAVLSGLWYAEMGAAAVTSYLPNQRGHSGPERGGMGTISF